MDEKLIITISSQLKGALGIYSMQVDKSMADVARIAIAKYINYDLSKEPAVQRKNKKYATPEERKEAQRKRSKARRDLIRELLEAEKAERDIREARKARESLRRVE